MTYLIRPQRDLDLQGASLLQQKAASLLSKEANCCWIIDMIQVKDINHFGLTTLVSVRKIARKRGCRVYLLNVKDSLRWIFEVTGFDQEFEILESGEAVLPSGTRLLLC